MAGGGAVDLAVMPSLIFIIVLIHIKGFVLYIANMWVIPELVGLQNS